MTVTYNIQKIDTTVTYNGQPVKVQTVICKQGESFDGVIDGGTL